MGELSFVTIFLIFSFIVIFVIAGIMLIKKFEPNPMVAFFKKYQLNKLSNDETTSFIEKIANDESAYPIEDKEFAKKILTFYKEINS